jgi:hypothetical protein
MTNYTITVSGAELAIVRRVLGRMTDAKEVKPRAVKPATFADDFRPNTGDQDLDRFMRASRAKMGPPKPKRAAPQARYPFGLKAMTSAQRRDAEEFESAAIKAWARLGVTVARP